MHNFSKWLIASMSLFSAAALTAATPAPAQQNSNGNKATQKATNGQMKGAKAADQQQEVNVNKERYEQANQWGGRSRYRVSIENGYFMYADALVWRAGMQDGYGFKQLIGAENGNTRVRWQAKHPKAHLDWGFRIGAGWLAPRDDWEVSFDWTHISTRLVSSMGADVSKGERITIQDPQQIDNRTVLATHAKNSVKFVLNWGDLMLKREFMATKWFAIQPGVGLKYLSEDEDNQMGYSGVTTASSITSTANAVANAHYVTRSDFWGFGPKGELKTRWRLGYGVSLFGDMGAALVYGRFNSRATSTLLGSSNLSPTPIPYKASSGVRMSVPTLDFNIGFEWNKLMKDGKFRFNAHIGWEHHVLFNILQNDVIGNLDRNNGNLTTQGITFGGRFDF